MHSIQPNLFPADNFNKYKTKHTPNSSILCPQDLNDKQDSRIFGDISILFQNHCQTYYNYKQTTIYKQTNTDDIITGKKEGANYSNLMRTQTLIAGKQMMRRIVNLKNLLFPIYVDDTVKFGVVIISSVESRFGEVRDFYWNHQNKIQKLMFVNVQL